MFEKLCKAVRNTERETCGAPKFQNGRIFEGKTIAGKTHVIVDRKIRMGGICSRRIYEREAIFSPPQGFLAS